ncbi:hypothetical protein [Reyranella sp.]|uniref:hypothetical protein n=1 Tax=Reyranella sp. TaxID=1929291 RepID=UPI003BA84897
MFVTYHFDNPNTDESHSLGGWSYVWAGLAGPVYVLAKGFLGPAIKMLAASIFIVLGAAFALVAVVGFFQNLVIDLPAVILLPLGAVVMQGIVAVRLVRTAYLRRGWREAY